MLKTCTKCKIEKLADLKAKGIITDEEFQAEKHAADG